ncbi:similar to Kazachstania africana KAFR_0G02290 hypothetical protein [Maudiozyma barnettii]|nr:similar to Kazachstania africana KAFR_0G02290 hypothetical protein [Kazachstania barnettii]
MANSDQEVDTPKEITSKPATSKASTPKVASPVTYNPISNAITSHIQASQKSSQPKKTVETSKKMPNIAQELAMNRNNARTLSPGAPTFSSSPIIKPLVETVVSSSTTKDDENQTKVKSKPKPRSKPKSKPKQKQISTKKITSTFITKPEINEPSSLMRQVKISSLLSSDELKVENPTSSSKDSPLISSQSSVSKLLSTPENILSTSTAIQKNAPSNIVPSVKKPTTSIAPKKSPTSVTSGSLQSSTTVPKKKTVTVSKPVLKRTKSNTTASGSNQTSGPTSKKSFTSGASKASKSKSATSLDSMKKKTTIKKTTDNTDKKKLADGSATASLTTANQSPPEHSKLTLPPTIDVPNLLSTIPSKSKQNNDKNSTISVVNIPLYSTSSNEYLDENGTVTFNLFKILKGNEPKLDSKSEMELKRKRLLDEEIEAKEAITDMDDDDDMENNDDTEKSDEQPKKKAHPMKGKNLIGKYDFEDPFIDDSEMLWEEQRASTKDGFFVFFGPLIAKGQAASFERADGTMKRGGIKK